MAQSVLSGAFLDGKKGHVEVECCNVLHVGKYPDVYEGLFFFCLTMMALEPTVKQALTQGQLLWDDGGGEALCEIKRHFQNCEEQEK